MRSSGGGLLLAARARAAAGVAAGAAHRRRAVAMTAASMHAPQQPASASSPWHDLLTLRCAVLRDAGAVLACPPLLRASRELPTCDALPPDERASSGGSASASAAPQAEAEAEARWLHQLAWLRALDAAAPSPALAHLAAAKTQARLGVYFQARRRKQTRMHNPRFHANNTRTLTPPLRRSASLFGCASTRRTQAPRRSWRGTSKSARPPLPPQTCRRHFRLASPRAPRRSTRPPSRRRAPRGARRTSCAVSSLLAGTAAGATQRALVAPRRVSLTSSFVATTRRTHPRRRRCCTRSCL
jgi:hypothetical protein